MKKKLLIILIFVASFILIGCTQEVKVSSISILEDSIPQMSVLSVEKKLTEIKLKVTKTDGSEEEVNLSKEMLVASELENLSNKGLHTLKVTYKGVETTLTLEVVELYSVRVLYPNNTPFIGGAHIQWCKDENCFMPVKSDEDGYAEINLEDGNYYIHIESGIPAGYTYDPNAYTTSASNKYVEIKLIPLSTLTGEGTEASPYVVLQDAYKVKFEEASTSGMKYFSFTPTKSGNFSIRSIAMDKLAINKIDPYIGFMGTSIDMSNIDVSGNVDSSINVNFNHTFEATANTTYYFVVMVSSATKFPASFEVVIEKVTE